MSNIQHEKIASPPVQADAVQAEPNTNRPFAPWQGAAAPLAVSMYDQGSTCPARRYYPPSKHVALQK